MAIAYKTSSGNTPKGILATPDHYVAIDVFIEQGASQAVEVDGRQVVQAGTIWPANDGTAQGVILHDYDVTDGDANGALILHGFIATTKIPEVPDDTAKAALKDIQFLPLFTVTPTLVVSGIQIPVGQDAGVLATVPVAVSGALYRPDANDVSNWTITPGSTNIEVSSIELSADNATAYLTLRATAATAAGTVTAVPKAEIMSLGVAPSDAATIATVA